jgi:ABC-type glycerol-3-phosphate transport system substrate-binding protein
MVGSSRDSLTRRQLLQRGAVGVAGVAGIAAAAQPAKARGIVPFASKSVSLDFWTISFFNGRTGKEKNGKLNDYYDWQIAQFKTQYPNASINVQYIPSTFEGWAKFDAAVAAGQAPDVMWGQSGNQWKYAPQGAIEPFNGHMSASTMKDFLPSLHEMITYVDGKTYLWPYGLAVAGGVFINTDLARKANAMHLVPQTRDRAWTTGQFEALAKALTQGGVYGTAFMTDWSYQVNQFLYGFGANIYNPTQTKMVANSAAGAAGLQWLVDLEHKQQVVAPGSSGRQNSQVLQLFAQQKIGIYPAQPYYITAFRSAPQLKPSFHWTFVQPPHTAGHQMGAEANVHGYIVSKQSDKDKLQMAMQFVKFLTRPDALSILAWGQGVVPPRNSMLKILANDKDRHVEGEIARTAKPWGRLYSVIGPKFWTPMLDSVFSQQKYPMDALNSAVSGGDKIIDQYAKKYHWPTK